MSSFTRSFWKPRSLVAGPCLLVLTCLIARGVAPPQANAQGKDPGHDLVVALRKECATKPKLRGTLIHTDKCRTVNGQLQLVGVVDTPMQTLEVQKAATELLEGNAAWKGVLPKGVTATKFELVPINSKYVKFLQKGFAEAPPTDRRGKLLRQTRLDEAYYDTDDALVFQGACLASDLNLKRPDYGNEIVNAIQAAIDTRPELGGVQSVTRGRSLSARQVKVVTWENRPVCRLQAQALQDPSLDGCLFRENRYDADGNLQIEGIVPNAGDEKKAEDMMGRLVAEHPEWVKPGKDEGRWSMANVKVQAPSLSLERLQKRLATSIVAGSLDTPDVGLRQTRIDRWYFSYPPTEPGQLVLALEGISLAEGFQMQGNPTRTRVLETLTNEAYAAWPALRKDFGAVSIQIGGIRRASQPRSELQRLVAANPLLDGVGIDDTAYFDEKGRLRLRGVRLAWPKMEVSFQSGGVDQERELRKVTGDYFANEATYFKGRKKPLTADDVAYDLTEVRSDEVHRDLQKWVGKNMDDSAIERLHFDDNGNLAVRGYVADPREALRLADEKRFPRAADRATPEQIDAQGKQKMQEVQDAVRKETVALVKTHPQMKGRTTVSQLTAPQVRDVASPAAKDGPPPVVELTPQPGLTHRLRSMVQYPLSPRAPVPAKKWDGIMLRRGQIAPGGKYQLSGLVDGPKQKQELDQLLTKMSKQDAWQRPLAKGWDLSQMKEMPVAPMVERLDTVMPAYPSFDGINVKGAVHDTTNSLVLKADVVGPYANRPNATVPAQLNRAEADLRRQLGAHEEWSERVEAGLRLSTQGRVQRPSPEQGQYMLGKALTSLSQGLLDPSIMWCLTAHPLEQPPQHLLQAVGQALQQADAALLHNPDDSTAWFVRAFCYQVLNDRVRLERDLRRMLELENPRSPGGPSQLSTRLHKIEPLQGDVRKRVNDTARKVLKEMLLSKPPLTVAEES